MKNLANKQIGTHNADSAKVVLRGLWRFDI